MMPDDYPTPLEPQDRLESELQRVQPRPAQLDWLALERLVAAQDPSGSTTSPSSKSWPAPLSLSAAWMSGAMVGALLTLWIQSSPPTRPADQPPSTMSSIAAHDATTLQVDAPKLAASERMRTNDPWDDGLVASLDQPQYRAGWPRAGRLVYHSDREAINRVTIPRPDSRPGIQQLPQHQLRSQLMQELAPSWE